MKFSPLFVVVLALVFTTAHATDLAVVNGKVIPASRLETAVKAAIAAGRSDTPELRAAMKEQLITQEVLRQEADKRGYTKKPEVQEAIDESHSAIPIRAMMVDVIKTLPVSDEEVKSAYDNYVSHLGTTEYLVSHIVVHTEAEAKDVVAKIKAGSKFEDLAKGSLDKTTSTTGGKLNWMPASNLPEPLVKELATLKKGQLDDTPVQTQNEFHVVRLDDTRPITVPSLESLKPRIADSLQQQKAKAFAADLRKQAVIK
jgi:peptidyl-prolyl cis-trans isomerase C